MSASFDLSKPIAIGSDHAGFGYKQGIVEFLQKKGFQVNDLGVDSNRSVDYPDFAHPVSNEVESGNADIENAAGIYQHASPFIFYPSPQP